MTYRETIRALEAAINADPTDWAASRPGLRAHVQAVNEWYHG